MISEITCLACLKDDGTLYIVDDLEELRGVWCGPCDRITWADEIKEYNSAKEVHWTTEVDISGWLEIGATVETPEALKP